MLAFVIPAALALSAVAGAPYGQSILIAAGAQALMAYATTPHKAWSFALAILPAGAGVALSATMSTPQDPEAAAPLVAGVIALAALSLATSTAALAAGKPSRQDAARSLAAGDPVPDPDERLEKPTCRETNLV